MDMDANSLSLISLALKQQAEAHMLFSFLHPVTLGILKAIKPFQSRNLGMFIARQGRWQQVRNEKL